MRTIELKQAQELVTGLNADGKSKAVVVMKHYRVYYNETTGKKTIKMDHAIVEKDAEVDIYTRDGLVTIAVEFIDKEINQYKDVIVVLDEAHKDGKDYWNEVFIEIYDSATQKVQIVMPLINYALDDWLQMVAFTGKKSETRAGIDDGDDEKSEDIANDGCPKKIPIDRALNEIFGKSTQDTFAHVTMQFCKVNDQNVDVIQSATILTNKIGVEEHEDQFRVTLMFDTFEDENYLEFKGVFDSFKTAMETDENHLIELLVTNEESQCFCALNLSFVKFVERCPAVLLAAARSDVVAFRVNKES